MNNNLRSLVLRNFKTLHRTRLKVFNGDEKALTEGRKKINDEFMKCKHIEDEASIKALLKMAEDVELILRTQVVQARQVQPGLFKVRLTEDTVRLENKPYDNAAVPEGGARRRGKACCQQSAPAPVDNK